MNAPQIDLWRLVHLLRAEALKDGALAQLPTPEREARLFAYVLEHLPIGLDADELIAGDFGPQYLAPGRAEELLRVAGHQSPPVGPAPEPSALQVFTERFYCRAGYTVAHTCADYERVVNRGLCDVLGEIDECESPRLTGPAGPVAHDATPTGHISQGDATSNIPAGPVAHDATPTGHISQGDATSNVPAGPVAHDATPTGYESEGDATSNIPAGPVAHDATPTGYESEGDATSNIPAEAESCHPEKRSDEGSRLVYLRGMRIAVQAVANWASRYADLARSMARDQQDQGSRERLLSVVESCERVPQLSARTFREAVQAIWLVHAAIGISELSGSSLSLGRLDQFLYPLYLNDLEAGASEDELAACLKALWRKLNGFGDPACAVNLGGVDAQGCDLSNPLSALIVQVTREVKMPSPILAARVHEGLSASAFDALTDPELFAIGQPTFYGEEPCREAMVRRGVPPGEAHRFALNSCMGIVMPGEEISDMWGAVANMLLPLELTLNAGQPFAGELPIALQSEPRDEYSSLDDLYAQFERYLDELVAYLVAENWAATVAVGTSRPNPFLSAITRDCVRKATDRALGGARYHCIIVEGFGWCNAADALTAIKLLVFDEARYTLRELALAAREDFAGHDEILRDILACPKYGNADGTADAMSRRITDTFTRIVSERSHDNFYYLPSYHTLNAHLGAGAILPASLDGRRAGDPLGKNAGPMIGRNRSGLTAVALSASSIDQRALSGGQALDISVDRAMLRDEDSRRKFQALLLTYFRRGGLQVQVNGLSADELRAAIADPASHQELTVKIAGYSERFVRLSRGIQEEMVRRFELGL